MVNPKKKWLWKHPDGRFYVRRTIGGVMTYLGRITAQPGTAEFDQQYWEIINGKQYRAKTSWSALIADYRKSDRWLGLKPRTRQDYERVMLYIEEKVGRFDVRVLRRVDVIEAQKANAHRTRFANYIVQVFVVLCEHAIDQGWIDQNPAKGIRQLKTPEGKKKAHQPWTDEAVRKFRAGADLQERLIFELGVGTVQRPGDWNGFTWGDYDGHSLTLRQNKTGAKLKLPCTPELKAVLDEAKRGLSATPIAAAPILASRTGRAMSYRTIAEIMLEARRRLDLEAFDLHALRYRGIMELAWAGCDDDEIASYSGHKSKQMIMKYAGEARQIMRAKQAAKKRN